MSYEVTALVTFWVDTVREDQARERVENLKEENIGDKIEVLAVQINRVDKVVR